MKRKLWIFVAAAVLLLSPVAGLGVYAWQTLTAQPELKIAEDQLLLVQADDGKSEVELQFVNSQGQILEKQRVASGSSVDLSKMGNTPVVVRARTAKSQAQYRLLGPESKRQLQKIDAKAPDFVQDGRPGVRNRALDVSARMLDLNLDQRDLLERLMSMLSAARTQGKTPKGAELAQIVKDERWLNWIQASPSSEVVAAELRSVGLEFGVLHTPIAQCAVEFLQSLSPEQRDELELYWPLLRSSLLKI
jgi:hypothetical protein